MTAREPLRVRFGEYELDEANAQLRRGSSVVELPPKAFDVLCALVRDAGRLLVKDALLDAVWGHRHVSESVLKTTISQVRGALGDDVREPRYVETAARRGYRFIAAVEVAGVAVDSRPVAAPPSSSTVSRPVEQLIGRAQPLAELERRLAAARAGDRQLVLLAGEAGIGKTTLVNRFLDTLVPDVALVAVGQCVEHYGAGEPFMPVIDALNALCRAPGGDALVAELRQVAPSWAVQLPWLLGIEERAALQRELVGVSQDRMLRELNELLERYSSSQPIVLVLEDLHWSDQATVRLLDYLCRRRGPARLMIVGTFRAADVVATDHPLRDTRREWRLHALCADIDLESLSEVELGELVARRFGEPAPESFVTALHAHTDGLPLFVVNVLAELEAERAAGPAGRWRFPTAAELNVPPSVLGAVEKRIGRLPESLQRSLGAASVLGLEFAAPAAAALLDVPVAALALERAAGEQWLREEGAAVGADGTVSARYAFRHALYRHVFYRRLSAAERLTLHRRAAAVLAATATAAELALHHELGDEPFAAARKLAVVGRHAIEVTAATEALRASQHALRLLPSQPDSVEHAALELELRVIEGVALTRIHSPAAPVVAQSFARARALCKHVPVSPATARALHGLWWASFATADLGAAREVAKELAAAGADGGAVALVAASTMGLTLAYAGEFAPAVRHLEAALTTYEQVAPTLVPGEFLQNPAVEALGHLALIHWWAGRPAEARRCARESIDVAIAARHPTSHVLALMMNVVLRFFTEEHAESGRLVAEAQALIAKHSLSGAFTWVRGHARDFGLDPERALEEARAGEQACRQSGMLAGLSGVILSRATLCHATGRFEEASAAVDAGLEFVARTSERLVLAPLTVLAGELALERGERAVAEQCAADALAIARAQGAGFFVLCAAELKCRAASRPRRGDVALLANALAAFAAEATPTVSRARATLARCA